MSWPTRWVVVAALLAVSMMVGNAIVGYVTRWCGRRTTLLLWAAAVFTLALVGVGAVSSFFPALALAVAACAGGTAEETTTTGRAPTTAAPATTMAPATTTTTEAPEPPPPPLEPGQLARSVVAPVAEIAVDGDPSDWALVPGLVTTLVPIVSEMDGSIENKDVTVQMAHDGSNVYMLMTVVDDYDWVADDAHLSAAMSVLFPVGTAGPHMGADDEEGANSTGMVDIWHWELECAAGVQSGGAVNPPGEGKSPGNDSVCNFDDEWSTDVITREDDGSATGENSLLGVWAHSNPTDDGPGVWYFEMSRPLQTGDEQDVQFAVGESTQLALAYWDADFSSEGWRGITHVQSSNQGWIQVDLID